LPAAVTFHPNAAREFQAVYHWYLDRHESTAQAFLAELDIAIALIAANPTRWPLLAGDIRRYLLKRFPFSVIYRIRSEEIQILAIAHTRRRPRYWEAR